ncbi:potassium channel family protein [Thermococcus radiotolerans]|uniref:Ion channel protein n=1 Tax=Thermococcus radiotolerans TaxID=187880 RepID=A0A2Z2MYF5_9EURY|nr:potassium channel family protein [Thermococcus radiotolerans]ASJ14531.1 Ion channel protein [Thermococcus radiotolerans]
MEKKTEEGLEIELIGFRTFFHEFLRVLYYVKSILLGLFTIIVVFGVMLSLQESLSIGDGIYFAFISAFTVGYGDITPTTPVSKLLCALVLPILGMIMTGIMVAAAMQAISRLYQGRVKKA